ncbi:MAG TPA: MBL fold metallo-hydrolase [Terriglobales bacterium]|jgi:L-ascorbate metabolism protein UlaG (beta-lactamase superfamily)
MKHEPAFTYIGGPTALIEWGGLRFLTDPAFDPAGTEYKSGPATLRKIAAPAIPAESLGRIDVVLLSHDHHSDNLDHAGRALLSRAGRVLTTVAGAERLGGSAIGIDTWKTLEIPAPEGGRFTITGTPCQHGPAGLARGPVTGFVISWSEAPNSTLYVSGDTVWYEGAAEISKRFEIHTAVLFMGAALVPQVVSSPLTMNAADGIAAARAFPNATIVPLHYEGWAHFSESREVISAAFKSAGLADRLHWLQAGTKTVL